MRGLNLRELEAVAGGEGDVPARLPGVSPFEWDRLLRQLRDQQREQRERQEH